MKTHYGPVPVWIGIALFVTMALCPLSLTAQGDWEAIGPEGGDVSHIVQHPTDANILYLVPDAYSVCIHKSIDRGATWNVLSTITSRVYKLAIAPSNPDIMYAATYGKIYKSTDGGVTWTPTFTDYDYRFFDIYVDSTDPNLLYAGGACYSDSDNIASLFLSIDGGDSWTVKQSDKQLSSFTMEACTSGFTTFYFSGYDPDYHPVVIKTTDRGDHWNDISSHFDAFIYDIAIAPSDPARIYAVSVYSVYRSTDSGSTWQVNDGYVNSYKLAVDPVDADNVYTAFYNCINKSTDGGVNFSRYSNGLDLANMCTSLDVDKNNRDVLYYTSSSGLFISDDQGESWHTANSGLRLTNIASVEVSPSLPTTVYLAVAGIAVFKTTNALGKNSPTAPVSWQQLEPFSYCESACDLLIDKTNADILYVLVGYS